MSKTEKAAGSWTQHALPRFAVVVLALAGFAFSVRFVQGLQGIVAPIFLALNLVIVVYPVQRWLVRRRVPAFLAAAVTIVLVLILVVAFFGLLAWSIAELVLVIPSYSARLSHLWYQGLTLLQSWGVTPSVIQAQLGQFDVSSLLNAAVSTLSNVSLFLSLAATAIMAVFFLAMDSMSIPRRLLIAAGRRPALTRSLSDFSSGVRRYWVVATIFGLIVAVLDVVALMVIGVPLALVWGVLAFLTNYIPNIGFIIGLVPPALMAVVSGDWWDAFWVVVAYCVLNFVIQSIIQPKFTGESVGVTPFISFLSLLFWTWVLGALGAILALPATLLVKALLVDADPRAKWVNTFISSDVSSGEYTEPAEEYTEPIGAAAQPQRSVVATTFVGKGVMADGRDSANPPAEPTAAADREGRRGPA